MSTAHAYICIDLKCFYASVECVDRGLDPFTTLLAVADPTRGKGTICLAISPAMKALGVRNRCRVYEIPPQLSYITAPPRMRRYMEVSAQIYGIYLEKFSAEDILVYSVDECFIDVGPYAALYGKTPEALAQELMDAIYMRTGICAAAGCGPNLFLAKVALDVLAKHMPSHIASLDEDSFKMQLWNHRPITDIWGIGPGISRRLATYGIHDLGGIAFSSEEVLFREFGIEARLLINHAWGLESATIPEIHSYTPKSHSFSNGQMLPADYTFAEARLVLREMVAESALNLVSKGYAAGQVSLYVGYSQKLSSRDPGLVLRAQGPVPYAQSSRALGCFTDSKARLLEEFLQLYDAIADRGRLIRRINISVGSLVQDTQVSLSLFDNAQRLYAEKELARAMRRVHEKFGKNALLWGTSLKDKATARERNVQVGGHHE